MANTLEVFCVATLYSCVFSFKIYAISDDSVKTQEPTHIKSMG